MTDYIVSATTNIEACCPSCQQVGDFTYAGEQQVPPRVAQAMGLTTDSITLWHCPNCDSTISEPELLEPPCI